jgi:restriction endonuclease S subunit
LPEAAGMVEVREGDVVFGKLRPYLAKSWLVDRRALCSSELIAMRASLDVDPRWLSYLVQSGPFVDWGVATSDGAKMPRTSWEKLGRYELDLPPVTDQRAIADHLDRESARLHAIVLARRKQVMLVEARFRAAVDREFETAAPRWRLKHLLREPLAYGAAEPGDADEPTWPRYIRTTDINEAGELRADTFKSLSPDRALPFMLCDGDILLTRSGATVGKSMMWRGEWGPACFAGYLIRARPDPVRLRPAFLKYYLRSSQYWTEISLTTIQATISNVSAERYADLRLPLPPAESQDEVVSRLDALSRQRGQLEQSLGRQIDLLLERRQAVIDAAMTGSLEIAGVAA